MTFATERLWKYQNLDGSDKTVILLQSFLEFLPEEGRSNLIDDIFYATTDDALRQLASSLKTGLLVPLKAGGGKTPITPSPWTGSGESIEHLHTMDLVSVPHSERTALRDRCIARDGHKCVITGSHDIETEPDARPAGPLETAHILPFSLGTFRNEEGRANLSGIWVNLYRYFPALRSRVNMQPDTINRTYNAMMMLEPFHKEFGSFHFCLEPVENTHHCYYIKLFRRFANVYEPMLPQDQHVRFVSYDTRYDSELPSCVFLELHAAVAKILHASGMGEVINKELDDLERSAGCLAPDGSTDIGRLLSVSSLSLLAYDTFQTRAPRHLGMPTSSSQQESSYGEASRRSG